MKTIKELDKEARELGGIGTHAVINVAKIESLKDVLELIDEHKSKDGSILKYSVIRMIKRITG